MGSVLAPFLLFFIWWLLDAVAISLRQDLQKSYITPWWQNANRIMIGCTILLIAYSYTFQFSDLNRLAKFLRYPGGPYSTVKEKVIQIGEPAIQSRPGRAGPSQ